MTLWWNGVVLGVLNGLLVLILGKERAVEYIVDQSTESYLEVKRGELDKIRATVGRIRGGRFTEVTFPVSSVFAGDRLPFWSCPGIASTVDQKVTRRVRHRARAYILGLRRTP